MILIADSGSTKTDWAIIHSKNDISILSGEGINPVYHDEQEIIQKIESVNKEKATIESVHFFGAGCIKNKTDIIVEKAFKKVFVNSDVFVDDDITGAAKSLFGDKKGIACILGTGSNSCYYNGSDVEYKIPALGYILGDEGSGAYLGKILLNRYFKQDLPKDIKEKFESEYKLDMMNVIEKVYKHENPNRYLATYSVFIKNNINNSYIRGLATKCLNDFFRFNIEKYNNFENKNIAFVGSIAYYYSDILKELAKQKNIKIHSIIQKPIDGLINYFIAKQNSELFK